MKTSSSVLICCLFLCVYLGALLLYPAATDNERYTLHKAQQDLDYILESVIENHPGIHNKADPDFRTQLMQQYTKASEELRRSSDDAMKHSIMNFMDTFDDRHVAINYKRQPTSSGLQECTKQFTIQTIKPGIHWIALPNFRPNNTQLKGLQHIIDILPTLRSERALIFDLRTNDGGNSQFAKDIVEALFGKSYASSHINYAESTTYVDWRASEGNLEHLLAIAANQNIPWLKNVITGMKEALQNNESFFKEPAVLTDDTHIHTQSNPVKADIFVIIDRNNFSAALDFIDYLKAMNVPITLVGQITQADTLYMECRVFDLPSAQGKFCLPIKVYRNRKRGHNVPYTPDIEWHGDIADTDGLQQLITAHVENKGT